MPNRKTKQAGAGEIIARVCIVFILIIFVFMNTRGLETATDSVAELNEQIRVLKIRVGNLEGYSNFLESQIRGLEVFDVVFHGDLAKHTRPLYDKAVENEFKRIEAMRD